MAARSNLAIDDHLADEAPDTGVGGDIRDGLTGRPKRLPSKYFYDERGSRLFERITEQPEYYLTRAETALLRRFAGVIARLTHVEQLVEPGSGAATKTRLLIDAGLRHGTLKTFVPVDVSRDAVERSAHDLAERYPKLEVHAMVGDFERHLENVPPSDSRLIALLGSTIGNFPDERAAALLREVRAMMGRGDWFLLGTDLVKDKAVLDAAYNDAQGVTAEFNRNILNAVNRLVDGNFDPGQFEHVSGYDEARAQVESHLRSRRAQHVRLKRLDLDVSFQAGEMMRTEISRKFTKESVRSLLESVGLQLKHWFTDGMFALSLARR